MPHRIMSLLVILACSVGLARTSQAQPKPVGELVFAMHVTSPRPGLIRLIPLLRSRPLVFSMPCMTLSCARSQGSAWEMPSPRPGVKAPMG